MFMIFHFPTNFYYNIISRIIIIPFRMLYYNTQYSSAMWLSFGWTLYVQLEMLLMSLNFTSVLPTLDALDFIASSLLDGGGPGQSKST